MRCEQAESFPVYKAQPMPNSALQTDASVAATGRRVRAPGRGRWDSCYFAGCHSWPLRCHYARVLVRFPLAVRE